MATKKHRANKIDAPHLIDGAFDRVTRSKPRTIQTCDFHLKIIRAALRQADPVRFSAVENYEIGMLIGMIEDVLKEDLPSDVIHGFIL